MNNLTLTVENEIAVLTITRPAALNALNSETLDELNTVLTEIEGRDDIKVVILTGGADKKGNEFKSFVAGADIAEMKDKTVEEAAEYGAYGNKIFRQIETLHCPVIAAVNGFALGGGCELSMACDIRIAAENAIFGQPEVGLGITPGFGGTQRLARLVPAGIAKEMIFTARNIKADKALSIGLVNAVVPQDELMAAALKMANGICKNAPIAVAQAKKAINAGLQTDMDSAIAIEVKDFSDCFATEDQTYGMECFVNKVKEKEFKNK